MEFAELEQRDEPALNQVDVLIGVVPNGDHYVGIWQSWFRTSSSMVQNLLNDDLSPPPTRESHERRGPAGRARDR